MIYYYNFTDFRRMPANVREMIENIYLVVNKKWNYADKKATEKMMKTFENPDNVLADLMAIMEVVATETCGEKNIQRIPENPEKILYEVVDEVSGYDFGWVTGRREDELIGKLVALATFVLKMAIYRFLVIYFPKLKESPHMTEISKDKISLIKDDMEDWEKEFWEYEGTDYCDIVLSEKRKRLKEKYKFSLSWTFEHSDCEIMQDCIERAFMDNETVDIVKELQKNPKQIFQSLNDSQGNLAEENNVMVEIRNMKQLLDIMEREIQGKQTEQDSILLRENAERWGKDIQKLLQMLDKR